MSTPNLVTLDNEEAKIIVGSNVPFVTGQFTQTGGALTNPFQTIERKDVGITLRIKPQIGENGAIRMTIFQEASSLAADTAPGTSNAGPTTNKRSIESNVMVDDGQILVLGGLIEDRYTDNKSKVPLLGDIPYLGSLFRTETRDRKRTNLMVFLRPTVLRDADTSNKLSVDRYDLIRSFQQDQQPRPNLLVPVNEAPVAAAAAAARGQRRADLRAADLARHGAAEYAAGLAAAVDPEPASPPRRRRRHPRREAEAMGARHPLPYAYAKAHTLLLEDDGARLILWAPETVALPALSEVLRLYDVDGFERESAETLVGRIAAAYAGGESSAAVVVGEVESAVDLSRMMQELPAIEDLLEASERRADHPHAQRPAHPGGEGRRQRHPHRALRALELGALSRRRHAARGGAAEPGAACGADLAPEDHGRARHRRAPAAAGRPDLAAHRRPRRRRARLDPAFGARRARGTASARQGRIEVHARRPGHERRRADRSSTT